MVEIILFISLYTIAMVLMEGCSLPFTDKYLAGPSFFHFFKSHRHKLELQEMLRQPHLTLIMFTCIGIKKLYDKLPKIKIEYQGEVKELGIVKFLTRKPFSEK